MARFVIARFVISRFCADSATCTAPPPMTAPPQAQAHSFAKAIFTDMPSHLPLEPCASCVATGIGPFCATKAKQSVKFNP